MLLLPTVYYSFKLHYRAGAGVLAGAGAGFMNIGGAGTGAENK